MAYEVTTGYMTTVTTEYEFTDPVQRTIIAVCFIIVTVLGVPGNTLVIFAVAASRKLQTSTNAFVVNLAVSDLVACLFVPVHVVVLLSEDLSLKGHPLCTATGAVSYITLGASIVNLALIAFNRYYLITRQRAVYDKLYSSRKISVMICLTWIYVIVVSFLPGWIGFGSFGFSRKFQSCTIDTDNELVIYNDLIRSLLFQLPSFAVIIFCYTSIYVFLRRQGIFENIRRSSLRGFPKSEAAKARNQLIFVRVTKNMFITVIAYLVCVIPFAIASPIPEKDKVIPWVSMLVVVNSCVNPLIFGFNHPYFKEIFGFLLRGNLKDIPEPSKFLKILTSSSVSTNTVPMNSSTST